MKLGDRIASVATPIARTLNLDCIDPETEQLKPESPCGKDKQRLNAGVPFWHVFYDRFLNKNKGDKMQFVIQVVVEAEDIRHAIDQVKGGTILSINPRPTAPTLMQNQGRAGSPNALTKQTERKNA